MRQKKKKVSPSQAICPKRLNVKSRMVCSGDLRSMCRTVRISISSKIPGSLKRKETITGIILSIRIFCGGGRDELSKILFDRRFGIDFLEVIENLLYVHLARMKFSRSNQRNFFGEKGRNLLATIFCLATTVAGFDALLNFCQEEVNLFKFVWQIPWTIPDPEI